MKRQKLCLISANTKAASIEETLWELGVDSVTLLPYDEQNASSLESWSLYEPKIGESPLWQKLQILAEYDWDVLDSEKLDLFCAEHAATREDVDTTRDYAKEQQEALAPRNIAGFLIADPTTYKSLSQEQQNQALCISPLGAFGTGEHPTTELCLKALANMKLRDKTGVDLGSGSGVLSFGALRLGAKRMHAFEIDPSAREASLKNALLMGLKSSFTIHPETDLIPQVDFLIANIYTRVLLEFKSTFQSMHHNKTPLILSGILVDRAHDFIEHMAPYAPFVITDTLDGWALVCSEV